MSINEHVRKIKSILDFEHYINAKSCIITLIISFVALSGYGLGKMSVLLSQAHPISINGDNESGNNSDILVASTSAMVIGSVQSKIYHLPWCPGARKLSEKNKVVFNSKDLAEKAGYRPASNCKGL
jgi:hypothetical protein